MKRLIAKTMMRFAHWLTKKSTTVNWTDYRPSDFIDQFRRVRAPSIRELLDELKNTAWTCASINAAVCASNPPKLYVKTGEGQPEARCRKKALPSHHPIALQHKNAEMVEEVLEHPALELFKNVNPSHNSFNL
jgi:hypothetical protein